MPDLESELRDELNNMLLKLDTGYSETFESGRHKGAREAIDKINNWIDVRPDGWHDLRENPEDLPEAKKKNLVIAIHVHTQPRGNTILCIDYDVHYTGSRWLKDSGCFTHSVLDVIAWQPNLEIPESFQTKFNAAKSMESAGL